MRDDIHVNAPVSRAWRRTIKVCSRTAEWEREGTRDIERALRTDARPLTENGFISKLGDELERQASALPGLHNADSLQAIASNPAQECAVAHAKRLVEEQGAGQVQVEDVVTDTLTELADRSLRATEAHVAQHSPRDHKELMRRMRACHRAANRSAIVASVAAGSVSTRPTSRTPLDLDAPLRRPHGG